MATYQLEANDQPEAQDSRAEILRQRIERRRADVVVAHERGVRVEQVEHVADDAQPDVAGVEASRDADVRVPQLAKRMVSTSGVRRTCTAASAPSDCGR